MVRQRTHLVFSSELFHLALPEPDHVFLLFYDTVFIRDHFVSLLELQLKSEDVEQATGFNTGQKYVDT